MVACHYAYGKWQPRSQDGQTVEGLRKNNLTVFSSFLTLLWVSHCLPHHLCGTEEKKHWHSATGCISNMLAALYSGWWGAANR